MVSREPLLLIVASSRMELEPIAGQLSKRSRARLDLEWSRVGLLGGRPVVLAASGAGRANAARAVERAAGQYLLRALVSTGWCGGLDPALRPGQVVVADRVLSLDPPAEFPACWPKGAPAGGIGRGIVLTVDRFVQSAQGKRELRLTGALAVEMEAAGVAAEAKKRNLPFYCIRAVSDDVTASFAIDYNRALLDDGRFSKARVVAQAGLSPARWKELLLFWRRARQAARALGAFFGSVQFEG
ncbi:MAG: hypothetical protein HY236_06610 [Acidobacteria bacterium]|nr:hypothetical protein [Acidobacteriota bacterium]